MSQLCGLPFEFGSDMPTFNVKLVLTKAGEKIKTLKLFSTIIIPYQWLKEKKIAFSCLKWNLNNVVNLFWSFLGFLKMKILLIKTRQAASIMPSSISSSSNTLYKRVKSQKWLFNMIVKFRFYVLSYLRYRKINLYQGECKTNFEDWSA